MARGKSLDEVQADAEKILRMWEANPTFALGELTLAVFRAQVEALRAQREELEELRRQVTNKGNQMNETADKVQKMTARALGGTKAFFGPDSTQYEEAGGTRQSEYRKKSTKKGGGGLSGASS